MQRNHRMSQTLLAELKPLLAIDEDLYFIIKPFIYNIMMLTQKPRMQVYIFKDKYI